MLYSALLVSGMIHKRSVLAVFGVETLSLIGPDVKSFIKTNADLSEHIFNTVTITTINCLNNRHRGDKKHAVSISCSVLKAQQ
jgi:hypothetical protein